MGYRTDRNVIIKIVTILFLLIFLTLPISCIKSPESDFTVKNATDVLIEKAEISVGDQLFMIENMKPGEKSVLKFNVKSDSEYIIKIKFANGKKLELNDGYLTNGIIYHDTITIKANEINLTSVPVIE